MPHYPSHFTTVQGRPDSWRKGLPGDYMEIEPQVLLMQQEIAEPTQVICGALEHDRNHAIYLIENISAVDLAREFETGSHNAWPGTETPTVCEELAQIFAIAPFRPYFVDAAGYKARFKKKISMKQAQEIERILTVGLEGYQSEWTDEEPTTAAIIHAENQIRLWWD